MVRSGREPPVFMAGGRTGTLAGWSGDGKMLRRTEEGKTGKEKVVREEQKSVFHISFLPSFHLTPALQGSLLDSRDFTGSRSRGR